MTLPPSSHHSHGFSYISLPHSSSIHSQLFQLPRVSSLLRLTFNSLNHSTTLSQPTAVRCNNQSLLSLPTNTFSQHELQTRPEQTSETDRRPGKYPRCRFLSRRCPLPLNTVGSRLGGPRTSSSLTLRRCNTRLNPPPTPSHPTPFIFPSSSPPANFSLL